MTDDEFEALKVRVARLAAQADEATARAVTATEDLLAEIRRRESGEDATVHPIKPG
jgi:hypothetical protein